MTRSGTKTNGYEDHPLVSVIIPVYNAEAYLEAAVESVLTQNYPNIEIIIIDDCSSDNSWKICCDFSSRFKKVNAFQTASNSGGPATPRNIGLGKTKGKYIAFLDADDVWESNKLESQVPILNAEKDIKIVCSYSKVVDESGSDTGVTRTDQGSFKRVFRVFGMRRILFYNYITMSSAVVRSEVFEQIKFEEWRPIAGVEDWALWMRVILLNRNNDNLVSVVQEPLVQYRDVESSLSQKDKKSYLRKTYILHAWLYFEGVISFPGFALSFLHNPIRHMYLCINRLIRQ